MTRFVTSPLENGFTNKCVCRVSPEPLVVSPMTHRAVSPLATATRTAMEARRQWLIEQRLAAGEGRAFRLRSGALEELGRRELRDAGARLAQQLGKPFEPAQNGDRIEGVVARRIDLEGGSYALVERSRDFTLVPWRDVLERNIGKVASGIIRGDGINWQFGRGRSGPAIT